MNDSVLMLSKKHGQLKQSITQMVQKVMKIMDDTPDLETKLSVIQMLRTVTEGKVYLSIDVDITSVATRNAQISMTCLWGWFRSLSRWKGPALPGFYHTSRKPMAILQKLPVCYVSYK